jgi:hypothetical protein
VPKTRPALTDEQRAERRRADREFAREAVEQLRSSEGWQRWLAARRHFHAYSLANQLLIAMQNPDATRVAGFRAWLALGYCVRKGECALRIWCPCPPSKKQLEAWQRAGGDPDQRPRTHFRLGPVFDRLSRVRSGGCRRRPRREIRCPPVSRPVLLVRASATAKGTAVACAVVAEPAPEGDGAAAIARAPRRYPREQKRADQMPRMPPPCPHTGNLADRRQVAEGCRLAPEAALCSMSARLSLVCLQPARSWLTNGGAGGNDSFP